MYAQISFNAWVLGISFTPTSSWSSGDIGRGFVMPLGLLFPASGAASAAVALAAHDPPPFARTAAGKSAGARRVSAAAAAAAACRGGSPETKAAENVTVAMSGAPIEFEEGGGEKRFKCEGRNEGF